VAACGTQLTVCRRPIDQAMQQRWKQTLGHFDELVSKCRQADIPLAMVVMPSPLQLNRPLFDAVCRRQGCTSANVDVELPQRRLTAYAADRAIPVLDLLPALRLCPEHPFIRHGWQWNDAGNLAVSEALSGWLQSTISAGSLVRQEPHGTVREASLVARHNP
jgi:hypothetical protein